MHGIRTAEETGEHLDARITAVIEREKPARVDRMKRWNDAVQETSAAWRESFGYKAGPIMDHHMVKREAREIVALVMKARLLIMLAPVFVYAETVERSLLIIGMLASPSGAGRERYAPKRGGDIQRIKV